MEGVVALRIIYIYIYIYIYIKALTLCGFGLQSFSCELVRLN